MDFRQIQYFLCLYEEGSITRAAHRLNIVQPALSMQLARLEKEIGQKLFERNVHGITPTDAARFMHAKFLPIMRDIARAQAETASLSGKLFGTVEIGMLSSLASTVLGPATQSFIAGSPDVQITVKEGYTDGLIDSVISGQLDAALVNRVRAPVGVDADPVVNERLCAVISTSSKIKLKAPVTLRQLANMRLILPSAQNGLRALIDKQAQAHGFNLEPRVAIDGLLPIIDLVQRTDGVTVLPPLSAYSGLRSGVLRALPLAKPHVERSLIWVHHARRPLSPATRKFIETVNAEIHAAVRRLQLEKTALTKC
jgi:DNA-binding transcriptional LysR family regulator